MDWAILPNLFLDQESSDVKVHVDTEEQQTVFPAHSFILKHASKVLKTMLEAENFKESQTGEVTLKVHGEMNDALIFLRYLYTGELHHLDVNAYTSLMKTAHLYEVDALVALCSNRIIGMLTPTSVCRTYRSVESIASNELLENCEDLMLRWAFLIFMKDLHLTLEEDTIVLLLKSDSLNVLNEEQVLEALWRWGCVRRAQKSDTFGKNAAQHLAKCLPLIRWSLIRNVRETDPWFDLWKNRKAFSGTDDNKTTKSWESPKVSETVPRKSYTYFELHQFTDVYKFNTSGTFVEEVLQSTKTPLCLVDFSVDSNILLVGLSFSVTASVKFPFSLFINRREIKFYETWNLLGSYVENSSTSGSQHGYYQTTKTTVNCGIYDCRVEFKTPVLIRKTSSHLLTIEVNADKSSVVRLAKCTPQKTTSTESNFEARFNFRDPVKGVKKLFYFVK